jgi:hypothetical protein
MFPIAAIGLGILLAGLTWAQHVAATRPAPARAK